MTSTGFTVTQHDQRALESHVYQIYDSFASLPRTSKFQQLEVLHDNHVDFLTRALRHLGPSFCTLDSNRPWLCYWILHSIALLGDSIEADLENDAIHFLRRCQDPNGGYGGGPGQMPHLATTYAAVNSLITLGSQKSLSSIDRGKLCIFLHRMKDQSGAFRMHDAGEMDVRACYTAISVASVLNILDSELVRNVGDYILSCQTYEGGISGDPGSEAHGGYTFCGLATMILIDEVHRLDLISLISWVAFRQGGEFGFQGRTNKLVDGCYSFWQGGALALVQRLHPFISKQLALSSFGSETSTDGIQSDTTSDTSNSGIGLDENLSPTNKTCQQEHEGVASASSPVTLSDIGFNFLKTSTEKPLFHSMALQQYILLCSQVPGGGFRDKPGKHRDYYHTCYCLSGLSLCQYSWSRNIDSPPLPTAILGPYKNLLEYVHPLFGIVLNRYHDAHEFFSSY